MNSNWETMRDMQSRGLEKPATEFWCFLPKTHTQICIMYLTDQYELKMELWNRWRTESGWSIAAAHEICKLWCFYLDGDLFDVNLVKIYWKILAICHAIPVVEYFNGEAQKSQNFESSSALREFCIKNFQSLQSLASYKSEITKQNRKNNPISHKLLPSGFLIWF